MRLEYSKCDSNDYWQVIDSYIANCDAGNDYIDAELQF